MFTVALITVHCVHHYEILHFVMKCDCKIFQEELIEWIVESSSRFRVSHKILVYFKVSHHFANLQRTLLLSQRNSLVVNDNWCGLLDTWSGSDLLISVNFWILGTGFAQLKADTFVPYLLVRRSDSALFNCEFDSAVVSVVEWLFEQQRLTDSSKFVDPCILSC